MWREVLTERELHIIKIINLPSLLFKGHPKVGGASSTGSSVICINHFIMKFTFMVTGRCSVKITDVLMDELSLGLGNVL